MNYKYKCGDEEITVFRWGDCDRVKRTDITVHYENKCYERTIREDENGRFFTWNKHKIYLSDWIKSGFRELKTRIESGNFVTSSDLAIAILTDGVDTVKFKSNDNEELKLTKQESEDITTCYKYNFSIKELDDNYTYQHRMYCNDFVALLRSGYYKILVEEV